MRTDSYRPRQLPAHLPTRPLTAPHATQRPVLPPPAPPACASTARASEQHRSVLLDQSSVRLTTSPQPRETPTNDSQRALLAEELRGAVVNWPSVCQLQHTLERQWETRQRGDRRTGFKPLSPFPTAQISAHIASSSILCQPCVPGGSDISLQAP